VTDETIREVLRDLTDEERESILSLGQPIRAVAGETIIEEDAAGGGFYLVQSGRVEVLRHGERVAELQAGAVIGEMALFNENVRTSEVRALEPCRLLFIPAPAFSRLVLQQDPAAVKVMQALGQLMVRRLADRDRALMERAAPDDPQLRAALDEFTEMRERLVSDWALKYHCIGKPGKIMTVPSKPVGTPADLSVAYSPGVAEPCLAIRDNPEAVYDYTSRGHLVGVVSNGTAVLGLGNIGPLAAKPVMEGKAVLFKRFADLDAYDLEINEPDTQRFIDVVCALEPTFGGINLEDIRAPECFHIEAECRRRMAIPVFHDDQHGTAIIAGAALLNALDLVEKRIEDVRVVFSGAGAAGFACAKFFLRLGVRRENLVLTDIRGVVFQGRGDGNYLEELAADTAARTLAEALLGADVFVGVSAPDVLQPQMLLSMNRDPIVFALANPDPEIEYHLAKETRHDVILATGRSDYPNQVNNVLAFPYIFRGALDVRAREVNDGMKLAATRALARLAKTMEKQDGSKGFGREALIPKPFDPRLLTEVPPAVAEAALETGAARLRLDLNEYRERLRRLAGN